MCLINNHNGGYLAGLSWASPNLVSLERFSNKNIPKVANGNINQI